MVGARLGDGVDPGEVVFVFNIELVLFCCPLTMARIVRRRTKRSWNDDLLSLLTVMMLMALIMMLSLLKVRKTLDVEKIEVL